MKLLSTKAYSQLCATAAEAVCAAEALRVENAELRATVTALHAHLSAPREYAPLPQVLASLFIEDTETVRGYEAQFKRVHPAPDDGVGIALFDE